MNVETHLADPTELSDCLRVRRSVFVDEQQVPAELENDGFDSTCHHVLARVDGEPVGTARLRPLGNQTAKVERVCVLPTYRGHNIGKQLMVAIEAVATAQRLTQLKLHAQVDAQTFYERLGYTPKGPVFVEGDIEHISMNKQLD